MNNQDENPLLNFTLKDLKNFGDALIPGLSAQIMRRTLTTYKEFIKILYRDLDEIVGILQENPELRKNDKEDRITIDIVNMLTTMGYDAAHERKIGGHTDVSIRGKNNFLWIGEAKIHGNYDHLTEGFQQLCTRYATGDSNQDYGGLLIYIRNKDAKNVITTWKSRISDFELDDYTVQDCNQRPDMVFFTTHKHERSGRPFNVKHIGISLYFNPKDHSEAA
ncbi:hypothetical protein [Azotobacter beijerinckii]|uniref:Restriction endonuclease n=1 Tax=Azotobacter beijerinckii TaxID=170623 RepID=A0A1I0ZYA0_9GAMM|nr:hypothetical protein [Azotobacter beijerinckii]SFB30332.1 hypothetical protein SAMN04244571_02160 [Azotobacter beijerinckii]